MTHAPALKSRLGGSDFPRDEIMIISGITLLPFQTGINIATTNGDIIDQMNSTTKKDAKQIYKTVFKELTKFTKEEFDKIYTDQGEEWKHFIEDYLIFAVLNYKLFNKPIQAYPLKYLPLDKKVLFEAFIK